LVWPYLGEQYSIRTSDTATADAAYKRNAGKCDEQKKKKVNISEKVNQNIAKWITS
jgi:hypothetical protein